MSPLSGKKLEIDMKGWDVLIVDDEADNLTLLEYILAYYDARVTTANSGSEALDLLQKNGYKLGLFDIQMPKVSGWDLIKAVRQHALAEMRTMPVIAVTAMAMSGDKER